MAALVLFGGGGDLAMRMLLPSLYFLEHDGLLPDGLKIIGAARSMYARVSTCRVAASRTTTGIRPPDLAKSSWSGSIMAAPPRRC